MENIENNQTNNIRRNPTRNNKNINRGQNEKSFDQETTSTGNFQVDPSEYSGDADYLGGSRVSDTSTRQATEFSGGPEAGIYDEDDNITANQQGGKGAATSKGVQKEQQQAQRQSGRALGKEKNEASEAGAGADYGASSQGARGDSEDEEKQMEGGGNKGGQVGGAFGKEKKGPSPDSLNQGM